MPDDPFPPASGVFIALMKAFAEFAQMPGEVADDAIGISFDTDAHAVRVLPHPDRAEQLVVEVDVCAIGPSSEAAAPLALVHRLNYAARFEHAWLAAVDPDDRLVLFTTRNIAATDPGELESLIVAGLEKAEALGELWRSAESAGDRGPIDPGEPMILQSIRG